MYPHWSLVLLHALVTSPFLKHFLRVKTTQWLWITSHIPQVIWISFFYASRPLVLQGGACTKYINAKSLLDFQFMLLPQGMMVGEELRLGFLGGRKWLWSFWLSQLPPATRYTLRIVCSSLFLPIDGLSGYGLCKAVFHIYKQGFGFIWSQCNLYS